MIFASQPIFRMLARRGFRLSSFDAGRCGDQLFSEFLKNYIDVYVPIGYILGRVAKNFPNCFPIFDRIEQRTECIKYARLHSRQNERMIPKRIGRGAQYKIVRTDATQTRPTGWLVESGRDATVPAAPAFRPAVLSRFSRFVMTALSGKGNTVSNEEGDALI